MLSAQCFGVELISESIVESSKDTKDLNTFASKIALEENFKFSAKLTLDKINKDSDDGWIKDEKYANSIYKVISEAISACVLGQAEFSEKRIQKDNDLVVFALTPGDLKYGRRQWNAMILYNVIYRLYNNKYDKKYKIHGDETKLMGLLIDSCGCAILRWACKNYSTTLKKTDSDYIRTIIAESTSDIKRYAKALNLYQYIKENLHSYLININTDKNLSIELLHDQLTTQQYYLKLVPTSSGYEKHYYIGNTSNMNTHEIYIDKQMNISDKPYEPDKTTYNPCKTKGRLVEQNEIEYNSNKSTKCESTNTWQPTIDLYLSQRPKKYTLYQKPNIRNTDKKNKLQNLNNLRINKKRAHHGTLRTNENGIQEIEIFNKNLTNKNSTKVVSIHNLLIQYMFECVSGKGQFSEKRIQENDGIITLDKSPDEIDYGLGHWRSMILQNVVYDLWCWYNRQGNRSTSIDVNDFKESVNLYTQKLCVWAHTKYDKTLVNTDMKYIDTITQAGNDVKKSIESLKWRDLYNEYVKKDAELQNGQTWIYCDTSTNYDDYSKNKYTTSSLPYKKPKVGSFAKNIIYNSKIEPNNIVLTDRFPGNIFLSVEDGKRKHEEFEQTLKNWITQPLISLKTDFDATTFHNNMFFSEQNMLDKIEKTNSDHQNYMKSLRPDIGSDFYDIRNKNNQYPQSKKIEEIDVYFNPENKKSIPEYEIEKCVQIAIKGTAPFKTYLINYNLQDKNQRFESKRTKKMRKMPFVEEAILECDEEDMSEE